jgi:uncharacterized protein YjbJ (UPF0337 family)
MRSLAILAVCVAAATAVLPMTVHAQTSGQTTTQNDVKTMWEKFKGSWSTTKGAVKEQWGKLTDDDILAIEGRRDQLVGKIQTRYGISHEEAEAQVSSWEVRRYRDM